MRVLVSGASGFIGSALTPHLRAEGHEVISLHRRTDGTLSSPWWDPKRGLLDLSGATPLDAVVHLAGENIVGRWTEAKKRKVFDSRVEGTRLLARAAADLPNKPRAFISASAIGYYGNRGNELVDETSPAGTGFLADVCRAWEEAALPAANAGIRVASLRFGLVLGASGGPLAKMLPIFRLGLGGPLGNGSQYWSWVAIDDLIAAVAFILAYENVRGPVNIVAPNPVTNAEFTRILARVLRRPAFFRVPAFALRLVFGREPANEMFLASVRVRPKALQEQGYTFRYSELEPALRHMTVK